MARRKRSYWDWILPAAAGATTEYFSKDFPAADKWGSYGEAIKAGLDRPHGCEIDTDGNIFIADSNNHRIRVLGAG